MNLTTTFNVGAAVFAVLALSACGQSRNEDVIAEDIFAPAVGTDDVAIDTVQTVFDDPFAPEAQLITDAGGNGGEFDPFLDEQTALTDASVPVVPVMTAPVYEETMPPQMQYAEAPQMQYAQPQAPSFNCGIAPSSKSQLMMFRQYCGGIAPQGDIVQHRATINLLKAAFGRGLDGRAIQHCLRRRLGCICGRKIALTPGPEIEPVKSPNEQALRAVK